MSTVADDRGRLRLITAWTLAVHSSVLLATGALILLGDPRWTTGPATRVVFEAPRPAVAVVFLLGSAIGWLGVARRVPWYYALAVCFTVEVGWSLALLLPLLPFVSGHGNALALPSWLALAATALHAIRYAERRRTA